jgi:3-oxoacyl-[acyl-carrier protein] reductase
VTGGASGIGLATSTMLCRNGAKVAINFLADDPRGKEAVAGLKASQRYLKFSASSHLS